MNGVVREEGELPRLMCGATLIVLLAALPTAMSLSVPRGFVLIKFAVGLPLACLAATAAAWVWWSRRGTVPPAPEARLVAFAGWALAAIVMISALQAEAWQQSVLGGYFRLEGALAWLGYLAAFFATRTWIRAAGSPRPLIDALLVGSIAPACYAIQQRFGLDFVTYGYGDASRSSGTLGNPVFLGSFLTMCVPLVLVRLRDSGMATSSRLMVGTVGLLQLGGIVASGSRAALFGLLAALAFLVCVRAHGRSARVWAAGLGSSLVAAGTILAVINLTDFGRAFAKGVPQLVRLVYDLQGADPASRSIRARLAMWAAAEAALREAPAWRLLSGYGPDVAHERFYAYMPVEKLRAEDFRREQVFDRAHADLLDTWAALGLAGLAVIGALFCAALHSTARRVFGCSARAAWFTLAGAAAGSVLLWAASAVAGAGAARWPLAGAGWVGGWLAAAALLAWRRRKERERHIGEDGLLAAGAGAALIAFWVDAQVGLPVFVTRLCFFVLLAVAITPSERRPDVHGVPTHQGLAQAAWVAACAAALLSFIPAFGAQRDSDVSVVHVARWLPVLCLLVLGRWRSLRQDETVSATANRKFAALMLGVAACAVLRYHVALPTSASDWLHARAAVESVLPVLLWLCPGVMVWIARPAGGAWNGRQAVGVMLASTAVALLTAWPSWHLMVASVAQAGSRALDRGAIEARMDLQRAAVEAAPWEWQHRYGLVDEALPAALSDGVAGLPKPAGAERYRRYVAIAEEVARGGLIEGSVDPWRPFLVGLVLQTRGLSIPGQADPEGVARASDEADRWLGESFRLFSVHPLIFEHLIMLKLDRGEVAATLRLIDQFETAFPAEPEPYLLRVEAGRRFGLQSQVDRGVEAARARLKGVPLKQVLGVAN